MRIVPGQPLRWGRALVPPALASALPEVSICGRRWTAADLGRGVWDRLAPDHILVLARHLRVLPVAVEEVTLPAIAEPRLLFLTVRTCNALHRSRIPLERLVDGSLTGAYLGRAGVRAPRVIDLLAELDYATSTPPRSEELELVYGTVAPVWLPDALRVLGLEGPAALPSQIERERHVSRAAVRAALAPYHRARAPVLLPRVAVPHVEVVVPYAGSGGRARSVLRELGGVAGARAIARRLSRQLRQRVTVRNVRDSFRNVLGVSKLGAGYYADTTDAVPVRTFVARLQTASGRPWTVAEVTAAVLAAYPHGDAAAIRAWLDQVGERE